MATSRPVRASMPCCGTKTTPGSSWFGTRTSSCSAVIATIPWVRGTHARAARSSPRSGDWPLTRHPAQDPLRQRAPIALAGKPGLKGKAVLHRVRNQAGSLLNMETEGIDPGPGAVGWSPPAYTDSRHPGPREWSVWLSSTYRASRTSAAVPALQLLPSHADPARALPESRGALKCGRRASDCVLHR